MQSYPQENDLTLRYALGLIKTKPKKTPADYPLLALRLPRGSDLEAINQLLDQVCETLNRKQPPGRHSISRGAVALEALEIGLAEIKRSPKKFISSK